jgi:nitrate/nitrite transporter NarK
LESYVCVPLAACPPVFSFSRHWGTNRQCRSKSLSASALQFAAGFAIWTTFEAMSIRFCASGEKFTLAYRMR